jgi:hypothetical protein
MAKATQAMLAMVEATRDPAPLAAVAAGAGAAREVVPVDALPALVVGAAGVLDVGVAEGEGRALYNCALWKVWQFDEAGTRGWYGIVEMTPSDSGG